VRPVRGLCCSCGISRTRGVAGRLAASGTGDEADLAGGYRGGYQKGGSNDQT